MAAKKKAAAQRTPKKAAVVKPATGEAALFDRVAAILEQARSNVVRAVNSNMVLAYWLIGREIVQEIQGGGGRAAYGKQVLADLSRKLAARYGDGFSETSLRYFRAFYLTYADRLNQIRHLTGDELLAGIGGSAIQRPVGAELDQGTPPKHPNHKTLGALGGLAFQSSCPLSSHPLPAS